MQDKPNERIHQLAVRRPGGGVLYSPIDETDWLWAQNFKWHLANNYVARSQRRGAARKMIRIFLHREILGLKHGYKGQLVDHINGDPIDNRRANLRIVTAQQNCQNRKSRTGSSSKYLGVSWSKAESRWRVQIKLNGTYRYLGYFDDEDEANRIAVAFRAEHGLLSRIP